MTPKTRISFNINCDMPGNMDTICGVIDEQQPTTVLAMTTSRDGMNSNSKRIFERVNRYGGLMTLRVYHPNNGKPWHIWPNHKDALNSAAHYTRGYPVWFELANEPRPSREVLLTNEAIPDGVAKWFGRIAYEGANQKQRITVPAWASGNYEYDDLEWWRALWQTLLDLQNVKDKRGFRYAGLSVHEYGHALPPLHCAGMHWPHIGEPQQIKRYVNLAQRRWIEPNAIDVLNIKWRENWLLFRSWWIVRWMREQFHLPSNWQGLDIWVTECLWDDMPNIRGNADHRQAVTQADALNGGKKIRGLKASKLYLETVAHALGWTGSELVCSIYEWLETIAPSCYLGYNQFSITEHGGAPNYWREDFSIMDWPEPVSLWTQRIAQGRVPVPSRFANGLSEPDVPPSTVFVITTGLLNLRVAPVNGRVIKTINPNTRIRVLNSNDLIKVGREHEWIKIEINGLTGFVAAWWVKLENAPEPEMTWRDELPLALLPVLQLAESKPDNIEWDIFIKSLSLIEYMASLLDEESEK